MKRRILFYCEDNATRSLIAEGIFRKLCQGTWEVYSAGRRSGGPHPLTLQVLEEVQVDSSRLVSKTLDQLPCRHFDLVLTLSEGSETHELGSIQGEVVIHLPFTDPAKNEGSAEPTRAFQQVRDQIFGRLSVLFHRIEAHEI